MAYGAIIIKIIIKLIKVVGFGGLEIQGSNLAELIDFLRM